MSVYKDNATGKWRVIYRYTDITGKRKQTQKRGFETKREAVAHSIELHQAQRFTFAQLRGEKLKQD